MSVGEGDSADYDLHNVSDYISEDELQYYYLQCGEETIRFKPGSRAAEMAVGTFFYPVLLVLGTLGNGVSVVILAHLSAYAWSSSLYLAVLSVVELLVLYIRCGGFWIEQVAGVNPSMKIMTSSDAMCKSYLFLLNVLLQLWPWLMVALSVELLIATTFPLKTYHVCTKDRARATILIITILLVCLNLNFFWTWGLLNGLCIYIDFFTDNFLNVIWPSIEMTVKHILPLIVVTVCFCFALVGLVRSRQNGNLYKPILRKYFLDLQALQQLKHASLFLVLLFIVVKAFTFAVELLNALEMRGVVVVPCERLPHYQETFQFVRTMRDASVYCFHSLKFFVYFAFCASFRRQFLCLLRKVFFCWKKRSGYVLAQTDKDNVLNGHREERAELSGHEIYTNTDLTLPNDLNGRNSSEMNKTTHV